MSAALTRRGVLRGSAAAALGLAAGAAPALAMVGPTAGKSPVVADAGLIDLAGRVVALASRRRTATERIERLELRVEAAHPRPSRYASTDEYTAHWDKIRPMEERIGLARLRRVRSRMLERLDRWAGDLAAMEPTTPAGLGAKASAVLAIDDLWSEDEGAEALILSVLRDAVRLGGGVNA